MNEAIQRRIPVDNSSMEVVRSLVRRTVFKTDGGRIPSLVCSIHIYLRHGFTKATLFKQVEWLCYVWQGFYAYNFESSSKSRKQEEENSL